MLSTRYRTGLRHALLDIGLEPIPLIGKAAKMRGWSTVDITHELIDTWDTEYSMFRETGLRLGKLVMVDVDCSKHDDPELYHEVNNIISTLLPATPLQRIGTPGRVAYLYRAEEGEENTRKYSTGKWLGKDEKVFAVEVLGRGSQMAAFGMHPSGNEFEWPDECPVYWNDGDSQWTPYKSVLSRVPVITREQREELLTRVCMLFEARGLQRTQEGKQGGGYENRYDLTPDMVFNTEEYGPMSVADMEQHLQAALLNTSTEERPSIRCCMDAVRPGATNPRTGQAGLGYDGRVYVSDHESELNHKLSLESETPALQEWAAEHTVTGNDDGPFTVTFTPEQKQAEIDKRRKALRDDLEYIALNEKPLGSPQWQTDTVPDWWARLGQGLRMPRETNEQILQHARHVHVMKPTGSKATIHRIDKGQQTEAEEYSIAGFARAYPQTEEGPRGGRVSLAKRIMDGMEQVHALQFRPDSERLLLDDKGTRVLNTYRPEVHRYVAPSDEHRNLYNSLLRRVAHTDEDMQWITRWLAYKIQHPWTRGPAVLSIASEVHQGVSMQGTGRGTFTRLLRLLLKYVREVPFAQAVGQNYQSQYTDWLDDTLLAVITESQDHSAEHVGSLKAAKSAYETFKELCDPGASQHLSVRKGRQNTFVDVYTTFFIATNHADVMAIPADDRRIYVTRSRPPSEVGPRFWTDVHAAMDDAGIIAGIYWYLRELDTAEYNPFEPVPMTWAKRALFEDAKSSMEQMYDDIVDDMPGDIIVPGRMGPLADRYCAARDIPLLSEKNADILNLIARKKGVRVIQGKPRWKCKFKGEAVRPLILRNREKWWGKANNMHLGRDVARELAKNYGDGGKPTGFPVK